MRGIYGRTGNFISFQAQMILFPFWILIWILNLYFSPKYRDIKKEQIKKETEKAYKIILKENTFFWFPKSLIKVENEILKLTLPKNFEITVSENNVKNIYNVEDFKKKYLKV